MLFFFILVLLQTELSAWRRTYSTMPRALADEGQLVHYKRVQQRAARLSHALCVFNH